MKVCLRQKCQKEFEPNKPKQVFCSAKCRVYFSRENKVDEVKVKTQPKKEPKNKTLTETLISLEPKKGGLSAFEIYQRKKLGIK